MIDLHIANNILQKEAKNEKLPKSYAQRSEKLFQFWCRLTTKLSDSRTLLVIHVKHHLPMFGYGDKGR